MTKKVTNSPADEFSELRRRAEEALSHASVPDMGEESIKDVRKLLSELQVHQIELEMQNDELRQAQIQLAAERERYADLYNFAPVAYFTVDKDDVILDLNLAAAELLEMEPHRLLNRPITPYLTPKSLQTFVQHREKARDLRAPQTCELTIRHRDGTQSIVQARTLALEKSASSIPLWRSVMTDITGQKRIEAALRESEEKFRSIAEQSTDMIAITNHEGGILYVSQASNTLFGFSKEEMQGHSFHEFLDKTSVPKAAANFRETIENKRPSRSVELLMKRKDGSTFIGELNGSYYNFDSQPGTLVIIRDVTERRHAEEELHKSERRYRDLFTNNHAVMLLIDPETEKIVDANAEASDFYGYTLDELRSMRVSEINTLDEDQLFRAMQNVQAKRQQHFFFQHRLRSGEIRDVEVYSAPIEVDGKNMFYSIVHDITEKKLAEEEIQRARARYYALFEQSHDAVFILDLDGRHLEVNHRAAEMLGYTWDELLSLTSSDIFEESEQTDAVLQRLLAGENIPPYERSLRKKNGESFLAEVSVELVRDVSGKPIHTQEVVRDITERKRAEVITQLRLDLLEHSISHSMEELLVKALDELEKLTNSQISFYHFVEADQNNLSLQAWSTRTSREFCTATGKGMHYPIDMAGVWVDCVKQRRPIIHNDYETLPHRKGLPDGHARVIRELVVPIMREDRVVSILGVGNKPTDYHESDIETISFIADVTWEIVQRKQAEERLVIANEQLSRQLLEIEQLQTELKEQALRDPLTGLYNRRYLTETMGREMARCRRDGESLSVIIMDVDHFKNVNDTYGHQIGDEFLKMIADMISSQTRGSDISCRYGGEEFLLLMPGTDIQAAARRAEDLRLKCTETSLLFEMATVTMTISFGVASFPLHGSTPDEILNKADQALYQSKRNGRNRVTMWAEQSE